MSRHLIPRLTLGEAESLIQKHGKKGEGMRIFSILVDADKILHDKGVEISKTHTVVPIADIQRSNAERRWLRIAHLRRMGQLAMEWADFTQPMTQREKLYRFAKRCDNEIARLRGER